MKKLAKHLLVFLSLMGLALGKLKLTFNLAEN